MKTTLSLLREQRFSYPLTDNGRLFLTLRLSRKRLNTSLPRNWHLPMQWIHLSQYHNQVYNYWNTDYTRLKIENLKLLFKLLLLQYWLVRLSGLFPFRITSEVMNLIDSLQDPLNNRSARRKAVTFTGQHKHRINVDRHECLKRNSNTEPLCHFF
jgi:hypothetical protein